MNIPAFCDDCGTIFPSGFVADRAFTTTLVNNKSGPCPKCGGWGHLPDGTFNFIDNTIEILTGTERSVSELQRLQKILNDAQAKSIETNEVKDILKRETAFKSIADLLPKNRTDLYAFITIILAIITIILSASRQKPSQQNINIDTVINCAYMENAR